MEKLIVLICFGVLSLFLCILSALYTKTEKVKTFIAIKGLASFSYVLLALISCNMIYTMKAYSLFIVIGIATFMFSCIIRAIPTKSDMFHAFYTLIEAIGFAFMLTSVFFLMEFPLFGLIGGLGSFLIVMIVYLVLRKKHITKDKLANLLLQLTSSLFLGITVHFAIVSLTAQAFIMAGGAILAFSYVIIQTFSHFTNKKTGIAKNILIGVALILLALSIYFI